VSLLWPETLYAGLFASHCWLHGRRSVVCHSVKPASPTSSGGLLQELDRMLDERAAVLRRGSNLSICVSDAAAAVASLAWQESLHRDTELEGYARIAFEKQGQCVDGTWVIHVAYRQFGKLGIAYALPRDWLSQLVGLLKAQGMHLRLVYPITAAAYHGARLASRCESAVQVLREDRRTSALIYRDGSLQGVEVEPVTASTRDSGARLLRRVSALHGRPSCVDDWSPEPAGQASIADFISDCLPEAQSTLLPNSAWCRP
jgi:hypothetical protein